MRYKCEIALQYEHWLTVGKIYEAEVVISPKEFSGGEWLLIRSANDKHKAYARYNQFTPYHEFRDALGV